MKTLNLVNQSKSDIKYKINKFPDGQHNIILDVESTYRVIDDKPIKDFFLPIQIKSRLNNWLDLELIICAVASLREINPDIKIHLYTPYIIGSRSDRKFEEGGNNYIRDVLAPVINSLNFKTVTCIDPHSYSLECCIKNFKSIDNSELVKFALQDILK